MQEPEEKLSRLLGILGTLSPHSQVTVQELSAEYNVSNRTIQRDIATLQNAKLGVFYDDGGKLKISRVGYRKIRSWMIG
ncbi:MAG: HTH domain-containing protein [Candidatus Brocadiae bacterium]|nr:HTH domain-containing protein [Candidatus Brocadiia bacterium]